jgi:hypothetical protein
MKLTEIQLTLMAMRLHLRLGDQRSLYDSSIANIGGILTLPRGLEPSM